MNISSIPLESLNSVRQALAIATLKKSMNQDSQSVSALINSMQSANPKLLERSVTPHKGASLDISV